MKPDMPMSSIRRGVYGEERSVPAVAWPRVEYCLHSGFGSSGCSFPFEDRNRRFHHLSREFLTESAREQKRELFVLGLIVLACAWPVVSMVVTVVQLYSRYHP